MLLFYYCNLSQTLDIDPLDNVYLRRFLLTTIRYISNIIKSAQFAMYILQSTLLSGGLFYVLTILVTVKALLREQ